MKALRLISANKQMHIVHFEIFFIDFLIFDDVMIILISSFDKHEIFKIFSQLILILFVRFFDDFVFINCLFFLLISHIVVVRAFNACHELFIVISCCVGIIAIGRVITAYFATLTKMVSVFFKFFFYWFNYFVQCLRGFVVIFIFRVHLCGECS